MIKKDPNQTSDQDFLKNFFCLTHVIQHIQLQTYIRRTNKYLQQISPTNIPHYTTANISNKYLHENQTSPPKPTIYTYVSRKNLLKGRNGLIDQQKKLLNQLPHEQTHNFA